MTQLFCSLGIALAGNCLTQGYAIIQRATPGQRLPDAAYRGLVPLSELPVIMSEASAIIAAWVSFFFCLGLSSSLPFKCISGEHFIVSLLHAILCLRGCFQGTQALKQNEAWPQSKTNHVSYHNFSYSFLVFYFAISHKSESMLPRCYGMNCVPSKFIC